MTDDLKERLLSWQPGQDEEALREEALARITDLEARLAAAEAGEDALAAALMGLRGIVEGIDGAMNHGTWRDENSLRLKDTSAWIAAYLALATYEARRKE